MAARAVGLLRRGTPRAGQGGELGADPRCGETVAVGHPIYWGTRVVGTTQLWGDLSSGGPTPKPWWSPRVCEHTEGQPPALEERGGGQRAGGAAACPGTTLCLAVPRRCHTNLGTDRAFGAESTAAGVQTTAVASRGVFAASTPPKTLAGPCGAGEGFGSKHRYPPRYLHHLFDPLRHQSQVESSWEQLLLAPEQDVNRGQGGQGHCGHAQGGGSQGCDPAGGQSRIQTMLNRTEEVCQDAARWDLAVAPTACP